MQIGIPNPYILYMPQTHPTFDTWACSYRGDFLEIALEYLTLFPDMA